MMILYGRCKELSYDFSKVASEDMIEMAKILDKNSNIKSNKELYEQMRNRF